MTNIDDSALELKVSKAKMRIMQKAPFVGLIAFRTPVTFVDSIATMATNGRTIIASRKFTDGLTLAELQGVIVHEVLHIVFLHMFRMSFRDPMLWNIACDFAINDIVLEMGFTLPAGGLIDKQYASMEAAAIYEKIIQSANKVSAKFANPNGKEGGKEDGEGETWGGMVEPTGPDGKPLSEADKTAAEEEAKVMVKQAAQSAKAIGKLPASFNGLIEALERSVVDWKDYIASWVKGTNPDDFSWRRPKMYSFPGCDVFTPRITRTGAGIGLLSIDTSGSVSDNELKRYVSEILGVVETLNPEKLFIVQHDSQINRVDEWEAGDQFTGVKIAGRGGTCIAPTFNYIEKMDEAPDWVICFSDMEIGDYPSVAPAMPVLWCATGKMTAPFGTYIDVRASL